jgi:voltage-gated potassium channel
MSHTTDGNGLARGRQESMGYSIFMLVLIVFSLVIMVLLLLPLDEATLQALSVFDNAICVFFLADFGVNLARSRPPRDYFIGRRGWLDLIGSIPSVGIFPASGLFRIARVSRLMRATPMLSRENRKRLIGDILRNRGQYALMITVLAAFLVLTVSTLLVVQFESRSPDANIASGADALWWSLTTITTVGYGDQYPVTGLGRLVGVFVMFAGVGIIGSLASILASYLVPDPTPADAPGPPRGVPDAASELAQIRTELAALRQDLEGDRRWRAAGGDHRTER